MASRRAFRTPADGGFRSGPIRSAFGPALRAGTDGRPTTACPCRSRAEAGAEAEARGSCCVGFGWGRRPAAMGVVARAGVLPQFATAAHPCAARPPWRQDGVLPARQGRGFDRCPGLAAIEHSAEIMERRQRRAALAVTPSIEATTPKIPEDAVSWGEGPSGTWMCHDPSKDRMSSRGMGPLPRARRPLPKPTLQPIRPEAGASTRQLRLPRFSQPTQGRRFAAPSPTAAAPADTRRRLG